MPPLVASVVFAGVGWLAWFGLEQVAAHLGAPSPQPTLDSVYVVLLMVQTGYFVTIMPVLREAGRRCIEELQPLLDGEDASLQAMVARFSSPGGAVPAWAWLGGIAIGITLQEIQFQRLSAWFAAPAPALGEFWTVLAACSTWSAGMAAATMVVGDALAMKRLGHKHVKVDLLRIDQTAAFSRYGVRLAGAIIGLAVAWAACLVLISSLIGNPFTESSNQVGLLLVGIYLVVTIAVFVFPQLGVRARIRDEKLRLHLQLSESLADMGGARALLEDDARHATSVLANRTYIESLPEWPARQHTPLRLTLFLLLPLLSWSAAALVEEFISRLIA